MREWWWFYSCSITTFKHEAGVLVLQTEHVHTTSYSRGGEGGGDRCVCHHHITTSPHHHTPFTCHYNLTHTIVSHLV